jgi:hypothetical protein
LRELVVRELTCICTVLNVVLMLAVLVAKLETVIEPPGFVIMVEPSVRKRVVSAEMEPVTVSVLVCRLLEAVRMAELIDGTVMGSEKRRSKAR